MPRRNNQMDEKLPITKNRNLRIKRNNKIKSPKQRLAARERYISPHLEPVLQSTSGTHHHRISKYKIYNVRRRLLRFNHSQKQEKRRTANEQSD